MSGQQIIIAVDVGTSGARAVLFDTLANVVAQVRKPYDMLTPQPGWSEQQPDVVVAAVVEALRDAVAAIPPAASLAGVTLSAQMYSILAVDRQSRPCSNSLTWADTRSTQIAASLRHLASAGLQPRTGCPLQAIYPLSKIRWLGANLPLPPDARFVSIKDYVLYHLTGQFVADWSSASASGLLDITRMVWDDEALSLCHLTAANLPKLVSPRHVLTSWAEEVRQHTGIPAGTPLVVGAGDAPLANIGVGAVGEGSLAVNIGTSAAARMLTAEPLVDDTGRLWTYVADENHWVTGGIIGSGGAVYEWLLARLLFAGRDVPADALFEEANRLAESVPPGAEGLLFIPYLTGEQSPGWKPDARGLVYGMTFRHEPRHFVRAAVEGTAFALLRAARAVDDNRGSATRTVYLTGGLTTSPVWPQTIANVFGAPVVVPRSPESSARGAAILGWIVLGQAADYDAFAQPEDQVHPDTSLVSFYQERFEAFCSLNHHAQNAF